MTLAFARKLAAVLLNLVLVVLAGGFAAAALVRYSPGFGLDETDWLPGISEATRTALRERHQVESSLPVFYARYLRAALHGDLGRSRTFGTPVAELLWQRAPVSLRLLFWGTGGGLILGGILAWLAVWPRRRALALGALSLNGLLIAIPPAVLALFFFFQRAPLEIAISLAILPRVFGTLKTVLANLNDSPALLSARARGMGRWRIAVRYLAAPALPSLGALTGVALVLAFGCLIPIEALCDVHGIGHLAWKAAQARDLPLLCGLALIITFAVSAVHSAGELAAA